MSELTGLKAMFDGLKARLAALRENPESGMTTEYVIVVALMAAAAIAIVAIIVAKVTAKANAIQTG
ncbi:MAG: hypothetical protein ACJ786_03835 [Catenulispora sp.]|jgi:hypothetical protein|nr:hypothetical protein [Catenulispora sp.]